MKTKREEETLSEEEKKALRGSKFAPLPSLPSSSRTQQPPRLAHPGGPLTTNKAAALAKFLERKLQDPNGLASINPNLLELAVKNAKQTVRNSGSASSSGIHIKHVDSFVDTEEFSEEVKVLVSQPMILEPKKKKKKPKKQKKTKKQKILEDQVCSLMEKSK